MGRLFISQKQAVLSGLAIFTTGMAATAQVVMDGSLGRAGTLNGPDYAITADLGQQHGGNLFHSFGQFSLQTGESATFSGPGSVSAIIGRVTGGQLSRIDGTLRSTIPNANLYLLNPAGVLFGEQAALDVSGSVHVSTADYLQLGGGGRFDARAPGNSVLTVAPVTAFGFLGDAPGNIAISGSFLRVREGQTLSLIGGDITLNNAHLYAPAGRINLAAAASIGEVIPTDADLVMRDFTKLGGLTLTQTDDPPQASPIPVGEVDVSGEGGGAIFVRSGQWFNQGGWVLANTYGAQGGGEINIAVADDLTLQKGGVISASTYGVGDAGNIAISAGRLRVDGQGDALTLTAIASNVQPNAAGDGGQVNIAVAETLTIENYGQIRASTFGIGDAGHISVSAGHLRVDGAGGGALLASRANFGSTGKGGNITLTVADDIAVVNQGVISTNTEGTGQAGDIVINASNALVDGVGKIAGLISGTDSSAASAQGGNITLAVADTLTLRDGGVIGASTFGAGDAGIITVNARDVWVDGNGSDAGFSSSAASDSTGEGGNINVTVADTLALQNGGSISVVTQGANDTGNINVNAGKAVTIRGGSQINGDFYPSGLFAFAAFTGQAGQIMVTTPSLSISESGSIDAQSELTSGGNLLINADDLKLLDGGQISSSVFGDERTQGGDVTVVGDTLVILNSPGITAKAKQGQGGNIVISTAVFLHNAETAQDVLNASSEVTGNDGSVAVNAPPVDIAGTLVKTPAVYLDASGQLQRRCGGAAHQRSRLVAAGRGALPPEPDSLLPAPNRCAAESPAMTSSSPPVLRADIQPVSSGHWGEEISNSDYGNR